MKTTAALALMLATTTIAQAQCPGVTLADMQGLAPGAYPQQYERAAFEDAAGCAMTFSANPEIEALNAEIQGNPDLPPLAERLPAEPLVVVPYETIGQYGGTFDALSNATEAGTSDFLSVRHVNLVRYADDLQTIVPNVATSWAWNDDFTRLTMTLREGHKWSDGAPFTAEDVRFWLENLSLDPNVRENPADYVLAGGEPIAIEVASPTEFTFVLAAPKPGLLAHFASSYAQAFQPAHFLGQFHPDLSDDAQARAEEFGFADGYEAIDFYFGASDWTDTPTPMLRDPERVGDLPKATHPTLESHIYVADTTEGRRLVANPYFFQVDPTGQQLPYISRQDERYINDNEVRLLELVNGDVDYKSQSIQLPAAPLLLENQESGGYAVQLKPTIAMPVFAFNPTHRDEATRALFADTRFSVAMSHAIDRPGLNEAAFFGQGTPMQYVGFSPVPPSVPDEAVTAHTAFDPETAARMLDDLGAVDADGDGFRDLPDGSPLVLNLQFATQGAAAEVVEYVAQNWADVGVRSQVQEVTPDEYRAAQSANELDVAVWQQGTPLPIALGEGSRFVPPYGTYFDLRTGMLWAEYLSSDGASGVEPPAWAMTMADDLEALQQSTPGSDEQGALAAKIAQSFADNLPIIGTVNAPAPIYVSDRLNNVPEFQTWSYEYYRTYPYRPTQWWLSE